MADARLVEDLAAARLGSPGEKRRVCIDEVGSESICQFRHPWTGRVAREPFDVMSVLAREVDRGSQPRE
jgi:hypothetical protein